MFSASLPRFYQCVLGAPLALLLGQKLEGDARCVWWFPYNGRTDDVLGIAERQIPGNMRSRKAVLVTEILLEVKVFY